MHHYFLLVAFLAISSQSAPLTQEEKLPTAKKGGTLNLPIDNNPKVMNPILETDNIAMELRPYLFASLCWEAFDSLKLIPYLAESYSVSKDRKTTTFRLREDAKWSDGTPITTTDVKFTFDSLMNPKVDAAPQRAYWEGVTLEVVDGRTFRFIQPVPKFDTMRSLCYFVPVQKKQYDGESDFNKAKAVMNPVGSGPYALRSFQRDQKLVLERVKDWWGSKVPHAKNRYNFDVLNEKILPEYHLQYEKLLKGEIDFMQFFAGSASIYANKIHGVDQDRFGKRREDEKDLWATEIKNRAPRGYSYAGWNLRLPIFQSKKTRWALAYLANYDEIFKKAYFNLYDRCISPFGSKTMNAAQDLWKKMPGYDPKKALALLKEDGWSDSDGDGVIDKLIDGKRVPFKFTLKINAGNEARAKIAQIFKEDFKKAGIQMEIQSMEWNAFLSDVDDRKFEAVLLSWSTIPIPNPNQEWHTNSEKEKGSNFIAYSNPKVDELILKANLQTEVSKRALVLQEINRLVFEDQPYLFIGEPKAMVAAFNHKLRAPVWAMDYHVVVPYDLYTSGD